MYACKGSKIPLFERLPTVRILASGVNFEMDIVWGRFSPVTIPPPPGMNKREED